MTLKNRRDVFKLLDLEHLNNDEFHLLQNRELDKEQMLWAVRHLSECRKCARLAPELSEQDIKDALAGTAYGKQDLIDQTINYYFRTLKQK